MKTLRRVRGIELRYLLTWCLAHHGPMSVAELIDYVAMLGFDVGGRASKTVSDALRWEMRLGRVCRRGRGWYVPGRIPAATEYRIHQRVSALRARAVELSVASTQVSSV